MVAREAGGDTLAMTREELELLAHVRIAAPCPVAWRDMQGDEKQRLCGQCNQQVHNLAGLTSAEVVALLRRPGERPCTQVFRRLDGTLLTKDCPSTWSVAVSRAVSRIGPVTGVVTLALVVVVAFTATVGLVFADNLRMLFGMTCGGLPGELPVAARTTAPPPPALPRRWSNR